jgi:hypothetical protein
LTIARAMKEIVCTRVTGSVGPKQGAAVSRWAQAAPS